MTTDLIQRLRAADSRLCREAAAEIDRLRDELGSIARGGWGGGTAQQMSRLALAALNQRPTNDESPQPEPGA